MKLVGKAASSVIFGKGETVAWDRDCCRNCPNSEEALRLTGLDWKVKQEDVFTAHQFLGSPFAFSDRLALHKWWFDITV